MVVLDKGDSWTSADGKSNAGVDRGRIRRRVSTKRAKWHASGCGNVNLSSSRRGFRYERAWVSQSRRHDFLKNRPKMLDLPSCSARGGYLIGSGWRIETALLLS
jgi:hypothetical protein